MLDKYPQPGVTVDSEHLRLAEEETSLISMLLFIGAASLRT